MFSEPIRISEPICGIDQLRVQDKENIVSILIPGGFIRDRIKHMADEVMEAYYHEDLHVVYMLDGAAQFFSDLQHFMEDRTDYNHLFTFSSIKVKSYHNDRSTGAIEVYGPSLEEIKGKDVLVVEDIVDTGITLAGRDYSPGQEITEGFIGHLKSYDPNSVRVMSLIVKDTLESNGYKPDIAGFIIPDEFVVGYGLDYNNRFRQLRHLCVLSEHAREKYAK